MAWHMALPLAQTAANNVNPGAGNQTALNIVLALLIVVGAVAGGTFLAKSLRMQDYGWKLGLILFALLAGGVIVARGWPPNLGIDLSGGVILVYEVDQEKKEDPN